MSPGYIKICGVTSVEDAHVCLAAGVSAVGLNFVPTSKRYVTLTQAMRIAEVLRGKVEIVAVVVNATADVLSDMLGRLAPDRVQLHGDEAPSDVSRLGAHAIKAVSLGSAGEVERALFWPGDFVLVDAAPSGERGGTGRRADWDLAASLAQRRKVVLAGGLTPDNVADAIAAVRPYGVDVASGVEQEPGKKDPARVLRFVTAAREAFARS